MNTLHTYIHTKKDPLATILSNLIYFKTWWSYLLYMSGFSSKLHWDFLLNCTSTCKIPFEHTNQFKMQCFQNKLMIFLSLKPSQTNKQWQRLLVIACGWSLVSGIRTEVINTPSESGQYHVLGPQQTKQNSAATTTENWIYSPPTFRVFTWLEMMTVLDLEAV